jgi:ribosome-associated toxin RatA of RatAB toxin-antitoxin module
LHIEQTQIVKAPRERVYQAWTDYEAWPKWQTFFTRVAVTKREGNTVYLDTDVVLRGRKSRRTEKHLLTPPARIDVEGEMEGITNTTTWKCESVPEGTQVTAIVDLNLPLRLKVISPLVKRQFRPLLSEWLQQLANYVEAK